MKKIRYAVVGLGHIAQVAVLPAFKHARRNSVLAALVTGSPKKTRLLAKKYKPAQVYAYEAYQELLSSGNIDAVYIALPNHLHLEYTRAALEAGIHVLCEKPLAVTKDECLQMIASADKTGAKLMTAYRLHFDKPTMDAIQLCRSGRLGKLKTFVSAFSFVIQDKNNVRLVPEYGGGPLYDIGVYCINAARYVFKENPVEVFGYATHQPSGPFARVEESVSATLRFPDERIATFACSFNAAPTSYFEVYGDKGSLRLVNAFEYKIAPKLEFTINEKKKTKSYKKVDQFAAELTYFSDCILENREVEPSGEEGLADVAVIEALQKSITSGKSVRVDYERTKKKAAPKPDMVERKPPVRDPELIDVKSAAGD